MSLHQLTISSSTGNIQYETKPPIILRRKGIEFQLKTKHHRFTLIDRLNDKVKANTYSISKLQRDDKETWSYLQKKKTYLRILKKNKKKSRVWSFFLQGASRKRERERERFAQTENTVTFRNKQRVGVKVVINTPRVSTRQTIAANWWFVYMRKMLPH